MCASLSMLLALRISILLKWHTSLLYRWHHFCINPAQPVMSRERERGRFFAAVSLVKTYFDIAIYVCVCVDAYMSIMSECIMLSPTTVTQLLYTCASLPPLPSDRNISANLVGKTINHRERNWERERERVLHTTQPNMNNVWWNLSFKYHCRWLV